MYTYAVNNGSIEREINDHILSTRNISAVNFFSFFYQLIFI